MDLNNGAVQRAHLGDLTGLNFAALVRLSFEVDPQKLEELKVKVLADLDINNREVQLEDCETYIRSRGGTLIYYYDEPNSSAWKKRKVKLPDGTVGYRVIRPIFDGVLEDLKRGLTPNGKRLDGLVVADFDRLTRDQRHLEDAIDVVMQFGRPIIDITGTLDLLTDSGRDMARIMVTIKSRQSADTSKRVRTKHRVMAEHGRKVNGPRAFGWLEDGIRLHPVEAPILHKAVDDLLAGVNSTRIFRGWNKAGVKTTKGNLWVRASFVKIMTNPRLAGWRIYQGRIATDKDNRPVKAPSEPLVSNEAWLAVCEILKPKTESHDPRRRRVYLLSGILRCGKCGQKLYGSKSTSYACGYMYWCVDDRTHIECSGVYGAGRPIDDLVTELVLAYLADHRVSLGEKVWPGNGELASLETRIGELMAAYRAGELTAALVFPNVRELEERRSALIEDRGLWVQARAGTPRVTNVVAEWPKLEIEQRRVIIETVISAIVLKPPTLTGTRSFDPRRLEVVWLS
ncbi:recombinase family protein [Frankia sp. AgB1.9]|uniref:recombinase family protein n=1 Tax=unclassified Frankia TaxID=2632575 RepID=UPI0019323A25|nr:MULTISPECIES: recombinase family protein [unclassified Frankia]MBL7488387.1 recombinase family protein [Frankia sp. AgW1.1]MBL7547665.1 recombinase family protein [Frankia sp. AgB1.9]MBL7624090.1 recombinase family protein [Frankia sp. AgB1.8]